MTKDLKAWTDRATANSYHPDKAQIRHDLGTKDCADDLKAKDAKPIQRKEEGHGWAPINPAAKKNTFTG